MDTTYQEAIELFSKTFEAVQRLDANEPAAMALATADSSGRPSVRIVLLRGWDERGFTFYTNSESCKGEHLTVNPQAALCFYWDSLGKQVRVEGSVVVTSTEESDQYWTRRARQSQLASRASQQSRPLPDRETYLAAIDQLDQQFPTDVPRPEHWHGYRIVPDRIEFWENRDSRMHERTIYQAAEDGTWTRFLAYP